MTQENRIPPRIVELHDKYGRLVDTSIFISTFVAGAIAAGIVWAVSPGEIAISIGMVVWMTVFMILWPLLVDLGFREPRNSK